jgi:hypothetical protein
MNHDIPDRQALYLGLLPITKKNIQEKTLYSLALPARQLLASYNEG